MVVENFLSLPQQRRYISDQESATIRPSGQGYDMTSHPRNTLPMQQLLAMRSVEDNAGMYGSPSVPPGLHPPVGLDLVGLAGLGRNVPNQLLAAQQAALQAQRKQREFIPDAKKDDSYWDRRRRNNEAAKRSREKRRLNDMVLETRVVELYKENHVLRAQLAAIRDKYGINADNLVSVEQVLATLPSPEQLINVTRTRPRILPPMGSNVSCMSPLHYSQSLSPTPLCPATSPAVHQRQSVLMSVGGQHPRSPSPSVVTFAESPLFQDPGKAETHPSSDGASNQRTYEEPSISRQTPALQSLTSASAPQSTPNVPSLEKDRCSPNSNNGSPSCDDGSRSPVDPAATTGRVLPHKLRHKTHLGDRDSAAATALLILNDIKHEADTEIDTVDLEEENVRSGGSSDERDSGISSLDWPVSRRTTVSLVSDSEEPPCKKVTRDRTVCVPKNADSNKHEEDHELRSKLARLVSEVESIKHFLCANTKSPTLNVN